MMHRCSGSQGNMVGPCSCDHHVFQATNQSSAFSMLFSSKPYDHDHHHHGYQYHHDSDAYSYSNPGVDCTLSLGTPSTRLSNVDDHDHDDTTTTTTTTKRRNDKRRSNFCWDLLQPKTYSSTPQTPSHKNSGRHTNNNNTNSNADPLLARRCANCDTTSTPLWRNGPRGPKSLCNACGIRFKKEERRATAAAAAPAPATTAIDQPSHVYSHYNQYQNNNWNNFPVHYSHHQPQKNMASNCNEFRFIDNDDAGGDTGISFLSWRLNVTDRPSLVHDFTR